MTIHAELAKAIADFQKFIPPDVPGRRYKVRVYRTGGIATRASANVVVNEARSKSEARQITRILFPPPVFKIGTVWEDKPPPA
jgi:hypothetical protein